MATQTRPMTADEFLLRADDGLRHELVRGELTSMPLPGGRHGEVAMEIGLQLGMHVKAQRLGKVYAAETGFLIERNPDTVRGADVAFVRRARLAQIIDPNKHVPFAPDLTVEVISPSERPIEIAEKTAEWLAAGASLVWNVYPETRTVRVHRPGADPIIPSEDDVLEGGDVVPGFRCREGNLFA